MVHHGTPQRREILARLLAERVVFSPELGEPAIDVGRRILGVEVVEVVLCEGLLGTYPHQAGHPGDENVANGVGIDGVNLGLVLDSIGLEDTGLEVDVIEILAGGLELNLGVTRVDGLGGGSGGRR